MDIKQACNSGRVRRRRRRYGRGMGSGRGKTCSRGQCGAKKRSGTSFSVLYDGGNVPFFRRMPKRGFCNTAFGKVYEVVNTGMLARFAAGTTVGLDELKRSRLVTRNLPVKILAKGELKTSLTVRAQAFSSAAREAIERAGGKAEVVS